ncbi:PiggyBac transposable element-derived protein 3, partial [Stegodyphus mimosarum]
MKQYLPMKPHKWGFKFFVLCGISGFAYKLELYSGQENNEKFRQKGEPDLGTSANVVIRLARIISRNKNYSLYFDNYYTSIPLLAYLSKEGIYSLGTINRNRIPNSKIPTEKVFNKMVRGHSMEFVGNYNDVAWKDNKTVIMASTFAGEKPLGKVLRYNKKTKDRIEIIRPHVIEEYNKHMGGVDFLDNIIAQHKILMSSKKWPRGSTQILLGTLDMKNSQCIDQMPV